VTAGFHAGEHELAHSLHRAAVGEVASHPFETRHQREGGGDDDEQQARAEPHFESLGSASR
jgi:hypothetical protein